LSRSDKVVPRGFDVNKKELEPMHYKPYEFELSAPIHWHEMGYAAGFGQDNAMGMGKCEVTK
jgi:hypothetical protein